MIKKRFYIIYILLMVLAVVLVSCKDDDDKGKSEYYDQDNDDGTTNPDDSYTYTLPVIFHVLYSDKTDATQYVDASRFGELITYVNEIYAGNVYGESENMKVKFELAKFDESQNKLSTPGVEYIQWSGEFPIDEDAFMSENTGKYSGYIWDPNEYINVMVYNFKTDAEQNGTTLGISHMPYTIEGDSALAGLDTVRVSTISKTALKYPYCVSINSLFINHQSSRYTLSDKGRNGYQYTSTDVVVTLAHELGHYLGLYHIFAEALGENGYEYADSCFESDYCDDTPSYNRVEYENYMEYYLDQHIDDADFDIGELLKRTNCDGEYFYSANILDYSIGYGYKISTDQKRRMRSVLYNSPLIPGPKVRTATTRSVIEKPADLPIRVVKCGTRRMEGVLKGMSRKVRRR